MSEQRHNLFVHQRAAEHEVNPQEGRNAIAELNSRNTKLVTALQGQKSQLYKNFIQALCERLPELDEYPQP